MPQAFVVSYFPAYNMCLEYLGGYILSIDILKIYNIATGNQINLPFVLAASNLQAIKRTCIVVHPLFEIQLAIPKEV